MSTPSQDNIIAMCARGMQGLPPGGGVHTLRRALECGAFIGKGFPFEARARAVRQLTLAATD